MYDEEIQSKIFLSSLNNLKKFQEFYHNDKDEFNQKLDNLTAEFSLWIEDTRTKLMHDLTLNTKEIKIEGFNEKNISFRNKTKRHFTDFDKIPVDDIKTHTRALKRRKNYSMECDDNHVYTKAKLNSGNVYETKKTKEQTEGMEEEKYYVNEVNIFDINNGVYNYSESNNHFNTDEIKNINNFPHKKFINERDDIIEEMPSKEEDNLKLSLTNKESVESKLKLGNLFSEIKKNSSLEKSEEFAEEIKELSGVVSFKEESVTMSERNKGIFNNNINNNLKDNLNNNQTSNSFVKSTLNINNNADLNAGKKEEQNSIQNCIDKMITNSGLNSVASKAFSIHNINAAFNNNLNSNLNSLENNVKTFSFSTKIINNNNITVSNFPKEYKDNSNITNSNTNKPLPKSNLLKDKELCMKILYNEDESSNMEDSPIVEKWNPATNCAFDPKRIIPNIPNPDIPNLKNIAKVDKEFNTPSNNKESKTYRLSHNNIYDDHKVVEDQKNKLLALKVFKTVEKNSQDYNNIQQQTIFTFNKNPISSNAPNLPNVPISTQPIQPAIPIIPTGYPMTDNSESSSDDDSYYYTKSKKKIPDWANDTTSLRSRLNEQRKMNPREIFGRCKIDNLDLNIIFSNGKYSYNRGDSADWKLDDSNNSYYKRNFVNSNESSDETKRAINFNTDH